MDKNKMVFSEASKEKIIEILESEDIFKQNIFLVDSLGELKIPVDYKLKRLLIAYFKNI